MCKECLKMHNRKRNGDDLAKPQDLKLCFCNIHNKPLLYYCNNCYSELCENCQTDHKNHILVEIRKFKYDGILNINKFEEFLIKAERIKKEKYYIISEIITTLGKNHTKDKIANNLLKETIFDIINEFYNDLKIEENLVFFAKIMYVSIKRLNKYNDCRVMQYKQILEVINQFFSKEEIKKFKEFIDKKKYIYYEFINNLSIDECDIIKNNIINSFNTVGNNDFNKVKAYIGNMIEYSNPLKKYIMIEKIKNPKNYININETINNTDNQNKNMKSKENPIYILSLISKCIEKNGTEVYISTKKDTYFNNIEISSLIPLFCLGTIKKYQIWFDFGEEQNQNIINIQEERNNFLKNWKFKISKILKINENNLIFTNLHQNSMSVCASIINENIDDKIINLLESQHFITKVEKKPIIESIQLSPDILDKKGDKIWKKEICKKRGGLDYINPSKDWIGIGLKVKDKFDGGNNDWLSKSNKKGEFAVAYLGLNNILLNKNINDILQNKQTDQNINDNSILSVINIIGFLINVPLDIVNEGFLKEGRICLFQKPDLAEEYAGIVNTFGYKIKIILMCRVNPKKIRVSSKYPDYLILNPIPDEIRPYRILFKKVSSSLTDTIKISMTPIDYIVSAINSKDFSFYDLAKNKEFKLISELNKQTLNNDYFTIRFYSSNYYYHINNFLRSEQITNKNDIIFNEKQIKSWICCLQLALTRNKNVKENTVVYRGISHFKFSKNIKIGAKFLFREFISTSLSKNIAKNFIKGQNGTLMIITIKNNGINGSPNYCYNIKDISLYPHEDEILISSHCCFEVDNIIRNKKKIDEVYLTCKGIKYN